MFNPEKSVANEEGKEGDPSFSGSSIFQKLYRSRFLRYLLIAGTLSFGNQFGCMEKKQNEEIPAEQVELARKTLDLSSQSEKFTEYVAEEGSPYLLSIGQVHSDVFLPATKSAFEREHENGLNDLIENQKNIENLILELASKHDIKRVYLESTPSTLGLDALREAKLEIEIATPDSRLGIIRKIHEGGRSAFDSQRGPLLYLLKTELGKVDASKLSPEEKSGFDEIYSEIENDPLIAGDNVYVWGGVMKLFLDGKIDVVIADSKQSEQEAVETLGGGTEEVEELSDLRARLEAVRLKAKSLEEQKDFIEKSAAANNLRESAALEVVLEDAERNPQKFYPIVYGVAHDFSNNIRRYNEENNTDFGLINIYEKSEASPEN